MEYLKMDGNFKSNSWQLCPDLLPLKIECGHQLNLLRGNLILTGGQLGWPKYEDSSQAWEGTIYFDPVLRIKLTPLPGMKKDRRDHVAFVIGDTIYCVGGNRLNCTEYFSYETNSWQKGPDLPFTLSNTKGVVYHTSKRFICIGGDRDGKVAESPKIGYFYPQKGLVDINGELEYACSSHFASLI